MVSGLTRRSAVDAGVIVPGLAGVGCGGPRLAETGGPTPLGDALFALAGACRGRVGPLSRRRRVDTWHVTGVMAVMALRVCGPGSLARADTSGLLAATQVMLAIPVPGQVYTDRQVLGIVGRGAGGLRVALGAAQRLLAPRERR